MRMRKTIGLSFVLLVASTAAIAQQAQSPPPGPAIKAKPAKIAPAANKSNKDTAERYRAGAAGRSERSESRRTGPEPQYAGASAPADQYLGQMRATGQREIGSAAWYGGRHIGRRTASGDLLDAVRPTAAHRTLPLHSLVRVTNLSNGRSVIVKITDRGPVSRSLIIDVSPRVADDLDMRRAGIARVAIEPVAPATNPALQSAAALPQYQPPQYQQPVAAPSSQAAAAIQPSSARPAPLPYQALAATPAHQAAAASLPYQAHAATSPR